MPPMSFASGRLRALLFDLDGTLVHTDPLHLRAWQRMLEPHGIAVDAPMYRRTISGRLNPDIIADLLPHLDRERALAFAEEKEAMFRTLAARVEPLPGLRALLRRASGVGLRLGLVTNAPAKNTRHLLEALQLLDTFEIMVLADELQAGKPDPLPYRLALQRLGVPPDRAVAFEDSISGIRSAVGAGLRTIGLATTHPARDLAAAGASPVVDDFTPQDLSSVLGWL